MNETKNFDSSYDSNDVRRRLASAARRLQSVLWKCTLVDVAIIALWLLTGIAPLFGNGVLIRNSAMPASISLLFIICALAPIFTSVARVAMITRVHPKNVRVDMMVNAPTTFRQIAYLTHHPYLGWWQWLGYVAVTAYFISNQDMERGLVVDGRVAGGRRGGAGPRRAGGGRGGAADFFLVATKKLFNFAKYHQKMPLACY